MIQSTKKRERINGTLEKNMYLPHKKAVKNKKGQETYRKQQNGKHKSNHIIKYNKCIWIKHTNQKAEIIKLDFFFKDPTVACLQETHFDSKKLTD